MTNLIRLVVTTFGTLALMFAAVVAVNAIPSDILLSQVRSSRTYRFTQKELRKVTQCLVGQYQAFLKF